MKKFRPNIMHPDIPYTLGIDVMLVFSCVVCILNNGIHIHKILITSMLYAFMNAIIKIIDLIYNKRGECIAIDIMYGVLVVVFAGLLLATMITTSEFAYILFHS